MRVPRRASLTASLLALILVGASCSGDRPERVAEGESLTRTVNRLVDADPLTPTINDLDDPTVTASTTTTPSPGPGTPTPTPTGPADPDDPDDPTEATEVTPGPQPTQGDGWRLLSSEGTGGATTDVAIDQATLAALFSSVGAPGGQGSAGVDFTSELVVSFGIDFSECAPRLDDVTVDAATGQVAPLIVYPDTGACTGGARRAVFVVAIDAGALGPRIVVRADPSATGAAGTTVVVRPRGPSLAGAAVIDRTGLLVDAALADAPDGQLSLSPVVGPGASPTTIDIAGPTVSCQRYTFTVVGPASSAQVNVAQAPDQTPGCDGVAESALLRLTFSSAITLASAG